MREPIKIDFSEVYDREDDIYYVSFKTGEPSFVLEVDDILLLEVGIFTNTPTGFRILNFKKHKIDSFHLIFRKVKKVFQDAAKDRDSIFRTRESQIEHTLEKVFAS